MPFPNRSGRPKKQTRQYSPLLTVRQAATEYGKSERTIWSWIEKGALPYVRVGPKPGVIRLRRSVCERELR